MSDSATVPPHLLGWFDSQRVVFRHDRDGQYAADLDSLNFPGVETIRVANDEFAILETVYPGLVDQLAASLQGGDDRDGGTQPPKQTVSVKTISANGISGVLETEEDVDGYLAALRSALVQPLNDGERISL